MLAFGTMIALLQAALLYFFEDGIKIHQGILVINTTLIIYAILYVGEKLKKKD